MKKMMILVLGAAMLLTGCKDSKTNYKKVEDDWSKNTTYWEDVEVENVLVENIEVENILVEDIKVEERSSIEDRQFIDSEYENELNYNTRSNVYFGD